MDEVIELEFIELPGIELGEPVANVVEQARSCSWR